jgi:hypothetical protein
MTDVIGIDHIYVTVSNLERHFGFVLRPSRVPARHEPYSPGLHHFCLRVDSAADVHVTNYREERRNRHDRWGDGVG